MLRDFMIDQRDEIIRRVKTRVAARRAPLATEEELHSGVPLLLEQLISALERVSMRDLSAMLETAVNHGRAMHERGFTLPQVVHGYGDVCQVVTALAIEKDAPISTADFKTFNLCLDDAIAGAVSEYGRLREASIEADGSERLAFLAHEIRNLLGNALISFDLLKRGVVPIAGSTGVILERSLTRLDELVKRSLAEVRLDSGLRYDELLPINVLFDEMAISATVAANARGVHLELVRDAPDAVVFADKHLLGSAIDNLVQNAIKFTPADGRVVVTAREAPDRLLIDVADQCGGIAEGDAERLFRPFEQGDKDRSGLGLGLAISRKAVRMMGGDILVRELAVGELGEKGCVFTIDLARVS